MRAAPTRVGPYQIETELGRGAMGVVYGAVHATLGRSVAIKSLPGDLTREGAFRERFASEARTHARLQHPNIVSVFDLLEQDGSFYIVMERFGSRSLETLLLEGSGVGLPEAQALAILGQVLAALDHAHSKGVIHRDVKPGNVLLGDGGAVKLTDFGIALLIGDKRLTQTAHTVGTPLYMSPEQILRPRELDHRTDLYSAGVLAFELLTGEPPFDEENDYELKRRHLETPVESLAERLSAVTPIVRRAVLKALEKSPADRFASAGAFLRALEGDPTALAARRRPSAPTRVAAAPRSRARFRLPIGLGVLLMAALGLTGLALARGWGRATPPEPTPVLSGAPPEVTIPHPIPEPLPAPVQETAPPPPRPVTRPEPRVQPPPPPPEPSLETRLEELRQRLAAGLEEARGLLAAQNTAGARSRLRELRAEASPESTRFAAEIAELDRLEEQISQAEIATFREQERERLARAAWDERIAAIESFLSERKYSEARSEASRLLKSADLPEDLVPRATALMEEADQRVREGWRNLRIETHSESINPRRKPKRAEPEKPPPPGTRGSL